MSTSVPATSRLIGHLRINYNTQTTPPNVFPFTSSSPSTSTTSTNRTPEPTLPSSFMTSTCTAAVSAPPATAHNPDTPTNINLTTVSTSDGDLVHTCSHYDRIFTSYIGLIGHLQTHRTETGEPAPGAPTNTQRIRLDRYHTTCTFTHRMGLLGHMRIHENLR
nr:unnamed protein product [Spirometra erinaceieuropaei]